MPFLTRVATIEDAKVVHAIIQSAFAEYQGVVTPPPGALRDTVDLVRERLAHGNTFLIFDGSAAIGTITYEPREGYLYVGRLAVAPSCRRQAVGTELMRHAEEMARRERLNRIRLGTRESMPSNTAFYHRLGYSVVQRDGESRQPDTLLWFEKDIDDAPAAHEQMGHNGDTTG